MKILEEIMKETMDQLGADEELPDGPQLAPEAVVAKMKMLAANYGKARDRFSVGDLVTPIKGANTSGAGEPHLIVEIPEIPPRNFNHSAETSDSASYGRNIDIRAMAYAGGQIICFWMESHLVEPWEAP